VQFYHNDLREAVERERISRENHLMIFKRIINKIKADRGQNSVQEQVQLEQLMKEFLDVAEGKLNPKLMSDQLFRKSK